MSRRLAFRLIPILVVLLVAFSASARTNAQAGDPYSLIDAVNSLRIANGLAPYEADPILMAIAQSHTDYQASIGQGTHYGPGGTRPIDRATAAGYGGGKKIFISENYVMGTNLSIDGAISRWLQDYDHIQTMLGPDYRDIGAGVSESDGYVYYTIDAAYVAGGGSNSPPGSKPAAASTPGGPTAIPIYLVQTAAPNPDGSIVHVVRSGQTLIGIAKAYGMLVSEIMDLNYLTSDVIYEGDKLTIRPAYTPGPTATVTATSTPTRAATATRNPTRTATASPTPILSATATPTVPVQQGAFLSGPDALANLLLLAIVILAAGGVIMMLVGSFMRRSPRQ